MDSGIVIELLVGRRREGEKSPFRPESGQSFRMVDAGAENMAGYG